MLEAAVGHLDVLDVDKHVSEAEAAQAEQIDKAIKLQAQEDELLAQAEAAERQSNRLRAVSSAAASSHIILAKNKHHCAWLCCR